MLDKLYKKTKDLLEKLGGRNVKRLCIVGTPTKMQLVRDVFKRVLADLGMGHDVLCR